MKRFLALFLCLMMVFSLAPVSALAAADEEVVEEVVEVAEPAPAEEPAEEATEEPAAEETQPAAEEPAAVVEEEPSQEELAAEEEEPQLTANLEDAVASVSIDGGEATNYTTIQAAAEAAVAGSVDGDTVKPVTIKLLADVSATTRYELRDSTGTADSHAYVFTLDMNGKTYEYLGSSSGAFILAPKATLTITGDGVLNTGESQLLYLGSKNITLNIESGSFTTTATTLFNTGKSATPKVNISGGSFSAVNFATFGTSTDGPTVTITGGIFNFDPTSYVDTDAYQVDESEGWYTVNEKQVPDVAEVTIGETTTGYKSMQQAIDAALAAGTTPSVIKVLDDFTANARYDLRKSSSDTTAYDITIVIPEGKTYTYTGYASTTATTGAFVAQAAKVTFAGSGTLDTGASPLMYLPSKAIVINITGGSYKTTTTSVFNTTGKASPTIKISGGTFDIANATAIGTTTGLTAMVTGGTFNVDPTGFGVDTTAYQVDESEGWYTVNEKQVPDVAEVTIGETTTGYKTMSQAVAAALDAGTTPVTLKVIEDVTSDSRFSLRASASDEKAYDITVEVAEGKKLTYTGTYDSEETGTIGVFVVAKNAKVTFTGSGTIDTGASPLLYLPASGIEINVTGGAYKTTATSVFHTGSSAKPTIKIKGGTFDVANATTAGTTEGYLATVTGGTFNVDPTGFGVDTTAYEVTESEGWYTVSEKQVPDVVEITIGETTAKYKSIKEAYANLPSTGEATVTLLENVEVSEQLRNNCAVTFDLNGKTISLNTSDFAKEVFTDKTNYLRRIFAAYAPLTIIGDGIVDATDADSADADAHYIAYVGKDQTLTISGGTYKTGKDNTSSSGYNYFSKGENATVIFNGESGSSWYNKTLKYDLPEGFYSAEVSEAPAADAPITFTQTAATVVYDVNGGIEEEPYAPKKQANLAYIDGMTVSHQLRVMTPVYISHKFLEWNTDVNGGESGKAYPAGGTISIDSSMVTTVEEEGVEVNQVVLYAQWKEASEGDEVAKVNGTALCSTLSEAMYIAASLESTTATVELLADVNENVTIAAGSDIILDMAGHSITGRENAGSAITVNGSLRITGDGYVYGEAQSKGGAIEVASTGTLTIESGKFEGHAPTNGDALYINGGTATILGGEIALLSEPGAGSNIYVYGENAGLYIEGGKISGAITADKNGFVSISGGIFSEEPDGSFAACGYTVCSNIDEETKTDYPYTVHDHNSETIIATLDGNNGYSIEDGIQIVKDTEGNLISTGKLTFKYSGGEEIPARHITVTGVEYDEKSGEITPASEKTGAVKIVAKLANDPLSAKKARSATVTGKIIPVQVAEYSWTLSDVTKTGSDIAIDAFDVKSEAKSYTITPTDIKDEAGNEIALEDVKFAYSTNDAKVATVNSKLTSTNTITIPKGATGQAYITMKVSTNVESVDRAVLVAVKDYSPRLSANAVTFDTQKNASVSVPVTESYGNAITAVEFEPDKEADKDKFTTAYSDGEVVIGVKNGSVLKNGTVSGKLSIATKRGTEEAPIEYTYKNAFKITIKNSAPSVTAKVVTKFNKFYTEPTSAISVSVKGCEIENVTFTNDNFIGEWAEDGILTVSQAEGKTATTGTITLSIKLEGYANPVTKAVKLTDETKAPTLVLDHTSSTLYKKLGTSDTFTVSVKGSEATVNITNVTTTAKATVASVEKSEGETNKFKVTILDDKGGSVPVAIEAEGWTKTVTVKPTVKVSTKDPATKLDKTKLTLNKAFGQSGTVAVSIDQTNVKEIEIIDKSGSKLEGSLKYAVEGGTVRFTTAPSTPEEPEASKGTYKFDITAKYEVEGTEYSATKQTVTVTVNEVIPKVTMTKVTINSNYDDSALLTAKVGTKGYELTDLKVADGVEGFGVESKDGKFYLTANSPATTTKSVALKAAISDADGNIFTVNSSVAVAFVNKAPAVTMKSSGKLDMITRDAGITYTVSKIANVNAKAGKVGLGGTDADKLEVTELTADAKGQQQFTVKLKDIAEVKAKDKLNFTINLELDDLCSGNKIEDVAVKQTQTVSESKLKVKTTNVNAKLYQSSEKFELSYEIYPASPAGAKLEVPFGSEIEVNKAAIKDTAFLALIENAGNDAERAGENGLSVKFKFDFCYLAAGKTYTIPVKVYAEGTTTPTLVDLKFTVAK